MMWYKGISHWIYQTFLYCIIHQDHMYENLNEVFFFIWIYLSSACWEKLIDEYCYLSRPQDNITTIKLG